MQENNSVKEVEINVLNMVRAMAKELVEPPIDELSDDAVETCEMIDDYISDNGISGFGVDVAKNGDVIVTTEGDDQIAVRFEFSLL